MQKDYCSDLKKSLELVETIKGFYISKGIPVNFMEFNIDRGVDNNGARLYSIRSNISFDMCKGKMVLG